MLPAAILASALALAAAPAAELSPALWIVNKLVPMVPTAQDDRLAIAIRIDKALFTDFDLNHDGRITPEEFVASRWAPYPLFARDPAEHVSLEQYELMIAGPRDTPRWRAIMDAQGERVARGRFAELDTGAKGYLIMSDVAPDALATFKTIDRDGKGYFTQDDVAKLWR